MMLQVTLAYWQATGAQDITGKIVAIYFPVLAFDALGEPRTHLCGSRPRFPGQECMLLTLCLPCGFKSQVATCAVSFECHAAGACCACSVNGTHSCPGQLYFIPWNSCCDSPVCSLCSHPGRKDAGSASCML